MSHRNPPDSGTASLVESRPHTPATTTLGMGADEMKEIAAIFKLVLGGTTANTIASGDNAGKTSKARYTLDEGARKEASDRVAALLSRYPVYPELDLAALQAAFPTK